MSSSNCCLLTCIQVSQEAGQVVWYSHLLKNFPQLIVIHTVKGFGIVSKAEIDVFLGLSCFFNDIIFLYGLWILIYSLDLSMISYLLLSHQVVSNSLQPHGLQHTSLLCPPLSPRACSNSWVNDAIQPSHPLSPPSPPALNFSQHQGLFQWVSSSHQVTKVSELQLQSFQWIFRVDFL